MLSIVRTTYREVLDSYFNDSAICDITSRKRFAGGQLTPLKAFWYGHGYPGTTVFCSMMLSRQTLRK